MAAIGSDMRMDLQYLIDRLENMVTTARRMPVTNKLMLDEQELADLIDQMRTVLPEEVRSARKVLRERDSIISEAQQQSDEILWALRRLEARGLTRGGHFVAGVTGEQFANETTIPLLRWSSTVRRSGPTASRTRR